MAKPSMYDNNLRNAAGLALRKNGTKPFASPALMDGMKKILREIDKTDAIRRYKWTGLPEGITGELIERIMYYRGMGMFFYIKAEDKFYFLPFALDGDIDIYGKYLRVTPVPFGGPTSNEESPKAWIEGLNFEPQYNMIVDHTPTIADYTTKCVILKDRSSSENFIVPARRGLTEEIIDLESQILPFMRTAMINSTGIDGVVVDSQSAAIEVEKANDATTEAALNGSKWVPISQAMTFQNLGAHSIANAETFLQVLQSVDNFRLGIHGLDNGGLFQKKAHMLGVEQQMSQSATGLILDDGLAQRQEACNIINSLWGWGVWCEVAESEIGFDRNLNGEVGYDDQDAAATPVENTSNKEVTTNE